MRSLTIYPNCSKGGVATVLRSRARRNPSDVYDFVFLEDRGGLMTSSDLANVNVRIVRSDRINAFVAAATAKHLYDEVRVLSCPAVANALSLNDDLEVIYEFHSSDMGVVSNEIQKLEIDRLGHIVVPSAKMQDWVRDLLPRRVRNRVRVEENLIDTGTFHPGATLDFPGMANEQVRPLLWVGRFDDGKGFVFLPRLLAQLPHEYEAYVVVSLEKDPARVGRFLSECDAMGVRDRVRLFMNLAPGALNELYNLAADYGGWMISTSLMESFGYAVHEALASGLRVAAFGLPVYEDLSDSNLFLTPIGGVKEMSTTILKQDAFDTLERTSE